MDPLTCKNILSEELEPGAVLSATMSHNMLDLESVSYYDPGTCYSSVIFTSSTIVSNFLHMQNLSLNESEHNSYDIVMFQTAIIHSAAIAGFCSEENQPDLYSQIFNPNELPVSF